MTGKVRDMGRKVAVVGGGAAGMMAAVQAAYAGARVTVYERNDRVGKKILSTGNGKCNFSNEDMRAACYYGSGAGYVDGFYKQFGVAETKTFFRELGMRIKDRNGYLYPASEQAATVLDVLRYEMERLGIEICAGCRVTGIDGPGNPGCRLTLETETAAYKKRTYDAVILACGGRAAPKTGSDGTGLAMAKRLGHRIVPTVPALTALRCGETFWKQVAGVRCEARLMLYIDGNAVSSVQGELQLTDYGISGIPVFQFSRIAAYALQEGRTVTVKIDLMPDPGAADTQEAFWAQRWERQKRQSMEQFVTGTVNKKVGLLLLKLAGIRETETVCEIEGARRRKLEQLFHAFEVTVKGTNSFEQAQVCAGGVDFAEVTDRLESVRRPGLFFAGEMLDIDGICGGYNLQWAWSSGAVTGRAAAGKAEFCPKKSRRPDVAHKMPDGKDM
ncbi:MAG: aminoacetone oxidase family FAD-binding enzyme [Lachnospiraceae bacterium]|nr:aminoacetone oxidase family FAD-binding enzyme [Lachnospiraceae bacterium]